MNSDITRPAKHSSLSPLLHFLISFPIAFFTGALVTDIAYFRSADTVWADASAWLLAVGILMGAIAALVGLIMLIANRRRPADRPLWPLVAGSLLVLLLALVDNLVHSRDGWTAVVPVGMILSAATVILTLLTLWLGTSAPSVPARVVVGARS